MIITDHTYNFFKRNNWMAQWRIRHCTSSVSVVNIPPAPSSTPMSFPDVVTTVGGLTAEARPVAEKLNISWRQVVNEIKLMRFIVIGYEKRGSTVPWEHCRGIYATAVSRTPREILGMDKRLHPEKWSVAIVWTSATGPDPETNWRTFWNDGDRPCTVDNIQNTLETISPRTNDYAIHGKHVQ